MDDNLDGSWESCYNEGEEKNSIRQERMHLDDACHIPEAYLLERIRWFLSMSLIGGVKRIPHILCWVARGKKAGGGACSLGDVVAGWWGRVTLRGRGAWVGGGR